MAMRASGRVSCLTLKNNNDNDNSIARLATIAYAI